MGSEQSSRKNIAAVILAAGCSTRMEGRNKLLACVNGMPMLNKVVNAAKASRVTLSIVVTGHEAAHIRALLSDCKVTVVHNRFYSEGMGSSLSTGIHALPADTDAVIVLLGDMPYILPEHINMLLEAHAATPDAICVPCYGGRRGNPVLWPRKYFKRLMLQSGDIGGRPLLMEFKDKIRPVEFNCDAILCDIDTIEALSIVRVS